MALAVFIAAMVQPGRSQMAPESQLDITTDGAIAADALASNKFSLKIFPKKGGGKGKGEDWKRGFDLGWQIGQCLKNYDNVKSCVAEFQQVFTTGDFQDLTAECCEAFTGVADDCLAMNIAGYLPQVRVPAATITAYCAIVKTLSGSPKFGVCKTNFGWGRPRKVEMPNIGSLGSISMLCIAESRDEEGRVEFGLAFAPDEVDRFNAIFHCGFSNLN
ncbi:hypothetical protein DITRI_Ditri07aG0036000 [Diplodiscus trichospermus]